MAAALALPNTGQAITIDVGGATELHPQNKLDVGKRLALVARKVAYGEKVLASGPTYRAHTIANGRVTVQFANIGTGLVSHGENGNVGAFAIAGADRHFVWAQARVEGNHVVVWSDQVPNPVAVRYAWGNSPVDANLYNSEGLPAAPFRTDRW
jgi:sialate O-acetylesterase